MGAHNLVVKCEHSTVWRGCCFPGVNQKKNHRWKHKQSCPPLATEKWNPGSAFFSEQVAIRPIVVWFQSCFFFTPIAGEMIRSNLTSMFFKWVAQPPTRDSGCIRTKPLMCLSKFWILFVGFGILWRMEDTQKIAQNHTKSDFRCKQLMYSDQDGRGKNVLFPLSDKWGSMFPSCLWVLGVVQYALHRFCLHIIPIHI